MPKRFMSTAIGVYVYLMCLHYYAQKMEQGDADSSGSTLRTMGVVLLVIAVVTLIAGAVYVYATRVATTIGSTTFPW